ncbi:Asp-tRNA(Asn)/Glu-tRNA(Gln) amidotransferase subunit GatB [Micavibrio aeruginosavorus]|uniref:Aspartyl/glutamyl-tRNA(Asn/Gln) amidotransferase subunit B n=1 Tax=Micavibrio aeruginosavorus EPB TaxID=349215 RepID=M4VEL8_9BACT|nr:Asp-tRNA(Asn)/Glu-tRNA(Gln) amidotransferase subunit GatB [Micavibrio aeruginosavorus]AGH97832.1 Aspartyl-tRNA(Asn) amidotransferase subunit B / Glutamyl-tRNA(Gln) amidotransferase subunit B [Micavibrio aeruginosavorus EPB]
MAQTIKTDTGVWEIVIGMEVHAQVTANSKLFSGSSATFGAAPNSQVSMVDAAMPGMLPVLNEYCVEQAVRTGLGLNAQINMTSVFERKNYFYPDLPQGYQISQFLHPIVGKGEIEIDLPDGTVKTIGITRLHLEQDAGKSLHDQHPQKSFVDLNRSGCALMEIVSEPDIRGADEATAYLSKLRMVLRYLGTCDGNMEEGSMRADVNVSVRRLGVKELGTRCEIKNVNSLKAVQMAIEYEAARQIEIIEGGGEIKQETRLWDPSKGETRSMRSKEEAHDYRYFPDPDLLPLNLKSDWVEKIKATLPELPDQKKHRFMDSYGLSAYDSSVLIAERARADYYEAVAKGRDAKLAANWVLNELLGILNKDGKTISESPVTAAMLGLMIERITDNTISGKIAKDVFAEMYASGKDADTIIETKGLKQVTDTGAIEKIVEEVLNENPQIVADYKGGNEKVFGFLVGQVMKKSQGKVNPGMANELLKKKLS